MNKLRKINRKGQEEIVGFVVIVVLVAVVFLVVLGLYLRRDVSVIQRDSGDVKQFLESTMEYTTECTIGSDDEHISVSELLGNCYNKEECVSGGDKIIPDKNVYFYVDYIDKTSGIALSSGNCYIKFPDGVSDLMKFNYTKGLFEYKITFATDSYDIDYTCSAPGYDGENGTYTIDNKINQQNVDSCEVLKRTLVGIIDGNWKVGSEWPFKGYLFNATYSSGSFKEEVIFIKEGTCAGKKIGAEDFTPSDLGTISYSFELCS